MAKSKAIRFDIRDPWDTDLSDPAIAEKWAKVAKVIDKIASDGPDLPTQWCKGDALKGVRF
jgi:hypothetical protein